MTKKSIVVSVRLPEEVYTMLKQLTTSKRLNHQNWLSNYGPVYASSSEITESTVAKELLVNAIGVAYVQEKNKC